MGHSRTRFNETPASAGTPREETLALPKFPGDQQVSEFHLWKVFFEDNPEAVAVLSADDHIVRINREFTRMFGYESDEAVSRLITDLIVPEPQVGMSEEYLHQLNRGERIEAEVVRKRKDGSEVYVSLLAVPVAAPSGEHFMNYAIYRDITDRKRAEERLRESEARFQAMADKAPVLVWTTGTDGLCNYFSKPWLDFRGRTMEQEVGTGWMEGVYPDDVQACFDGFLPAFHAREPFSMEYRLKRADGEYRWVIESGVPRYTPSGEFAGYIGSNIDITDHKRAESLLAGEKRVLEMLARGDSLPEILEALCRLVEEQANDFLASILLLDDDRLRHGAAPSLPKSYSDAIDGTPIGPSAGSCGTAAYRGEQVIVEDIATDPLWANYRDLALSHGLGACWATPIFSAQRKVIATFAMYCHYRKSPSKRDQEVIERITHLAGVAVERKMAQDALRRSEGYLVEAQRLNHTGSWTYNPATEKALYWSDEMFRIHGFDPDQGPPTSALFLERVHPEDRQKVYDVMRNAARKKTEYKVEHRIIFRDGTIRHIHAIGHPVLNRSGDVVEFVGSAADITERKQAEEALRRSEAYLADSQRMAHVGSWAWAPGREDKSYYWSDEGFRIFGLERPQPVPTPETIWQRIHPEDRQHVQEAFQKAQRDKEEYVVDFRFLFPDKRVKYVHAIGHPVLDDAGEIVEFAGTIIDLTDQKLRENALRRSEAYLAEAQRLAHTGSWAFDPNIEKMVYWSEETFRIFGRDPGEGPPTLEAFRQRIHPEDRERVHHLRSQTFGQKVEYLDDFRILLPDGTVKYVHVIGHPALDETGKILEYIGTVVDVTERKRAEEERARIGQLEADLARISRVNMMGELAAALAHEIYQPVTAALLNAKTCTEWLSRDEPDLAEACDAASRMVTDTTRTAHIIDKLRSLYSRDASEREWLDVNEIIREMVVMFQEKANRTSVSIRSELAPGLPAIRADRVQIQQVLANLILNGIEAMKDVSGELKISSSRDANEQLLISVTDSGIGITHEQTNKLFEAFYTTKSHGTGMGLSISRRIIESHGGCIKVKPNPARGATFEFTLPIDW